MRLPTLTRLQDAFGEADGAECYALLKGWIDPCAYPSTRAWVRSCYHEPSQADQRLHACDVILEGYGIEGACTDCGDHGFSYVNFGDTYDTTLILHEDTVSIGAWGDLLESCEDCARIA